MRVFLYKINSTQLKQIVLSNAGRPCPIYWRLTGSNGRVRDNFLSPSDSFQAAVSVFSTYILELTSPALLGLQFPAYTWQIIGLLSFHNFMSQFFIINIQINKYKYPFSSVSLTSPNTHCKECGWSVGSENSIQLTANKEKENTALQL